MTGISTDCDMNTFLIDLGFSRDEIDKAFYELDEYRSIPGTTLKKYLSYLFREARSTHPSYAWPSNL